VEIPATIVKGRVKRLGHRVEKVGHQMCKRRKKKKKGDENETKCQRKKKKGGAILKNVGGGWKGKKREVD